MYVLLPPYENLIMYLIIGLTFIGYQFHRYRSLCAMLQIFYLKHDTSLDPLIVFGSDHKWCTRLSNKHIRPEHCRSSATKNTFHHIAVHWWNDLPDDIVITAFTSPGVLYDYILCYDD